jgi:SAM-dependent methyltransferase
MRRLADAASPSYSLAFHAQMRLDMQRVRPFWIALQELLSGGGVVADLGCGTGVLSILACRAGADRVYAVDVDREVLAIASTLVRDNQMEDRIFTIEADARSVTFPEPLDCVVAEMLHAWMVEEHLGPAIHNTTRFLKATGSVIPSSVSNHLQLVNVRDIEGCSAKLDTPMHIEFGDVIDIRPLSKVVHSHDWYGESHDETVCGIVQVKVQRSGLANALRLTSEATVHRLLRLTQTATALNDILVPVEPVFLRSGYVRVYYSYKFGCRWDEISLAVEV